MKRGLSLCIVVVLVVGLMGVYFWSTQRAQEVDEILPSAEIPALFHLADRTQEEVSRIGITQKGITRIFTRGELALDNNWYLADNPDLLLDTHRVQEVLRPVFNLTTPDRIVEHTEGLNLAEFGLYPPQLVVSVWLTNGNETAMYVGYETPDRQHFFMQISNDAAIYLIPRNTALRWQVPTEALLCRFVPPINPDALTVLRITQNEQTVEAIRPYESQTQPLVMKFPVNIEGLEVDVFNLNHHVLEHFNAGFRLGDAVTIYPDDLSLYGLDDPSLTLFFEMAQGSVIESTHLLFGNLFSQEINGVMRPFIYVKFANRPHVFSAELAAVELLFNVNPMLWVNRFVAIFPILEVERITFNDWELIINHVPDSNAIFPTINGVIIPEQPFRVLYRLLIALRADSLITTTPPSPVNDAVWRIAYHFLDGTKTTIDLFAYDDNFFSFSVDGEYVWAVTNHRDVNIFLDELVRLYQAHV